MARIQNRTYDVNLELKDAGLVAASAAATVAAAAMVLDLSGGTVGHFVSTGVDDVAHVWGDLILEVTALEIASNDEIYDIVLQFSPDEDFTAATIRDGISLTLAASEVQRTDNDRDSDTGRYVLPFSNDYNGVPMRYCRIYTVVDGTIATGINFTARLGIAAAN